MAAPIRFLSGRQQQQKIGIEGSTENQKVLEVVGRVGIGTTIFNTSVELEVRGDQIITGILTVGNIDVTGVGGSGGEIEVENLNVTGFSTFGNTADFNGDIDVDGHTELDDVNVSGASTFTGAIDANGDLDVDGHTELDDVNVSGASTFAGAADFNGNIDVDGHTELDNLNVSGVSTFVGVGTFLNNLYVSDNVYISGFLTATRLYSSVFGEFTGSSVSADNIVGLALSIAGLSTFTGAADFNGNIDVDGHTELDDVNVSGAITATTFSGNLTGNSGTATALETARNFEITGDVVASVISFDGTGNVSLAATIQPNSVELGTDTTGDYVESVSGTANEIQVTSGTGEGSTPTIGFVANPTIGGNVNIGQDLTVTRDVQIVRNLNVNGNITVGGTSATLFTETLKVSDSDIVLGFRTDANGNDISNDTTASHGGVALASTEGTPLVSLVGAGETLPSTYKKIMWFKSGSFAGLGTDAWLSNYAVGIGSTQFPTGTRLAAGSVQFTENDLAVIRNINASGIITASNGFVGNLTGIASTASNLTRSVIAGNGLTGGGELTADRTLTVGVGTGITINSDNVELRNSGNLTGGTITKWDDGNGQLTDSLVTETGTIVNVGSGITFFTSTGIISATAYFGSGGDLEDIIKSKLEGITARFKPHDSGPITLGSVLGTVEVDIIDNTTVGFITAVGLGSTAQYYFNDVTAVGLTTDASVNTTGIITASGFTASGGVFTGDGSGLTNLGSVSAGVTVSDNGVVEGTAAVLNFGENIDVSSISAGVVTFSLNNNQNFTGIVTISSFKVSGASTFTGAIDANGDLDVDGHTELDDLNVSGVSTFTGAADFNGDLDVDGHTELDDVNVSGASTFAGAADFNGDLDVDGHTELDDVNVTGFSTLTNVKIGGQLYDFNNATGSAGQLLSSVGSGISWTNTTTTASGQNILPASSSDTYNLTSSDIVSGVATAGFIIPSVVMTGTGSIGIGTINPQAKLSIDVGAGITAFDIQGSAGQLFSVTNNLTSGSIFSVNDVSGIPSIDVDADGTIQLAPFGVTEKVGIGKTNPSEKLDIVGNIQVGQATTTSTNWSIIRVKKSEGSGIIDFMDEGAGITTTTNPQYMVGRKFNERRDSLAIWRFVGDGNGGVGGHLAADALFQSSGDVYVNNNLGIGITNPTSKLHVVGNTELDNLNVSGVSTFTGAIDANGDLDVDGHTELDNLNVSGVSTFTGAIDANGDLDVDGHTELDNLNVSGVSTFQSDVTFTGLSHDMVWDKSDNTLEFADGARAAFGTGSDLIIQHNSGQSSISESNGNGLEIKSIQVTITPNGSAEKMAEFNANSSVDLYYNDSKKFETTGYGATVLGTLQSQQLNVSGVSTFTELKVGTAITMSAGIITATSFTGAGGNPSLRMTGGKVNFVDGVSNFGYVEHSGTGDLEIGASNGIVLASDGSGVLYVNLNGNVGIGTATPSQKLDVNGNIRVRGSLYDSNNSAGNAGVILSSTGAGVSWTNSTTTASGQSILEASASIPYYISASPITSGVSTAGFVESDIVIKNGNIGIGSTQPLVALDVAGNIREELHTPAMPVGLNEDIGLNWTKVNIAGAGLAVNHIDSLAYCGDGIVLAGDGSTGGDIYRSTDYGLTFTQIELDAMTGGDYEFIFAIVYCGNGIVLAGAGFESGDGDILRSTDYGVTWSKSYDAGADVEYFVSLTYCGNGIVLAGSATGTGDGDVYRSTDFGLTFTKIEMVADLEQIRSLEYCGNGIALAGGGNSGGDGDIYRSTDYGATWTKVYEGVGLEQIVAIEYCGNGIVLAGGGTGANDGNVYRSTDYGLTYTSIELDTALESVSSLAYCDNGVVLAGVGDGTGDGDIFRSTDYGLTWTQIELEPPGSGLETIRSLLYLGNGIALAGSRIPGDIYRSDVGFSQATSLQGVYHEHLTGNIGIGTTTPTTKLHVIGEVTATDFNSTSDAKLKTNVQVIEDPLEKVLQIDGVSFNWIENNKPSMGVIADNIQEILPELVSNSDPKTVNYNGLIGLLIECVKQQQVEIEELKRKIG